jgi:dinuclear metal center YbgI/SA1388 family protein
MKLDALLPVLEEIAPVRYAADWDNVGLLAGDPSQPIHKVLLTIDYTTAVADEARREGCDVVFAYHPPVFRPVKRVVAGSLLYDAIRRGVALYSPHTALDVAEGGTNDMLADALGMMERAPLRAAEAKASSVKLVVFVPEENVAAVSQAMFDAGAGRIGAYSSCSFRSAGTGTFFGEEGANPAVGERGKLEEVAELRVETVVPLARVAEVVTAMRAAHPYEEPAFDLVSLVAAPSGLGMGRVGAVPRVSRGELFRRVKAALGVEHLLVAGPTEGDVERAAACAGSCGDLFEDAIRKKADVYLTGEMRHHDVLRAAEAGMTVICARHSASERAVLSRVAARIAARIPDLPVVVSREDRDPLNVV